MPRILIPALAASLITFAFPSTAEAPAYALIKEKSALKFFAIQNQAPVEGAFSDFTVDIRFDPEHPEASRISAEIATGSVSVANQDVNQNIRLPDWLSVEAFPKASFVSTKITRTPLSDDYFAEGKLTLRGKTMPVTLNFSLQQTGSTTIAKGFATLRRNDFGVGQGAWAKDDAIKNEVRVEFRLVAEKK